MASPAIINPHEFATVAVRFIKYVLAEMLVKGIRYEKINEWYEMTQLQEEIESWRDYLIASPSSAYDHIEFQSEIERRFVEGLESDGRVKVYLKLPKWFTVPTPVGEYNPDWAIVMDNLDAHGRRHGKDLLYLVRETKDASRPDSMRPNEIRKTICGKAHFEWAFHLVMRHDVCFVNVRWWRYAWFLFGKDFFERDADVQSFLPPSARLSVGHYAQCFFSEADVQNFRKGQSTVENRLTKILTPDYQNQTIALGNQGATEDKPEKAGQVIVQSSPRNTATTSVEEIVTRHGAEIRDSKIWVTPNIPPEKLQGAIRSYAQAVSPGDVLLLADDTLFGGCP